MPHVAAVCFVAWLCGTQREHEQVGHLPILLLKDVWAVFSLGYCEQCSISVLGFWHFLEILGTGRFHLAILVGVLGVTCISLQF